MILGSEYLGTSLRIAMVVVPVAGYFLILGLLNSRRRPQLLTGREDFSRLMLALCLGFVLPILERAGLSPAAAVGVTAALVTAIWLLGPERCSWVVYNLPPGQADRVVRSVLAGMGWRSVRTDGGYRVEEPDITIRVSGFRMLRNVSVRLAGPGASKFARWFGDELARVLARTHARAHPMGVAMLLVATAMMVAPLALIAHRAPEFVRLLVDLWQ